MDGDEEEDPEDELDSSEDMREAWKRRERERERNEANAVEGCDIYITRWRVGRPYVRVSVLNLHWFKLLMGLR